MTYSDFCQFCGSFVQHMLEMRIVRYSLLEFMRSLFNWLLVIPSELWYLMCTPLGMMVWKIVTVYWSGLMSRKLQILFTSILVVEDFHLLRYCCSKGLSCCGINYRYLITSITSLTASFHTPFFFIVSLLAGRDVQCVICCWCSLHRFNWAHTVITCKLYRATVLSCLSWYFT